jgi:hypothetical protein
MPAKKTCYPPEIVALAKEDVRQYVIEITKADDCPARLKVWMRNESGVLYPVETDRTMNGYAYAGDAAIHLRHLIREIEGLRPGCLE